MGEKLKFTCPCCGYKTLDEPPPGTFDICAICFWEDDEVQFGNPDFSGGANVPSLRQAQASFNLVGACEDRFRSKVRSPTPDDERDSSWQPL